MSAEEFPSLSDKNFKPIRTTNPDLTIDACIAMMCGYYGTPLPLESIAISTKAPIGSRSEMDSLQMFEKFGFRAIPLEGPLNELPAVPRPCLVSLKGEPQTYAVLLEMDDNNVTLVNPLVRPLVAPLVQPLTQSKDRENSEGRDQLTLDQFARIWSGEAIQVDVRENEIVKCLAVARASARPSWQWRSRLGWVPPYTPKVLFLGFVVFFSLLNATQFFGLAPPVSWNGSWNPWIHLPLSLILCLAFWSFLFGKSCRACNLASISVENFPYAEVGLGFYGGLFLLSLFIQNPLLLQLGVFGAFGGHVYLVNFLRQKKLKCYPCLGVAANSLFLTSYFLIHGWSSTLFLTTVVFALVGALVGGFGLRRIMSWYQNFTKDRKLVRFFALSLKELKVLREKRKESTQPPLVQMLTFTKKDCMACTYFKSLISPLITEKFGGTVVMTEKVIVDRQFPTPFILIEGTHSALIYGFVPIGLFNATTQTIEKAMIPVSENSAPSFIVMTPDMTEEVQTSP